VVSGAYANPAGKQDEKSAFDPNKVIFIFDASLWN